MASPWAAASAAAALLAAGAADPPSVSVAESSSPPHPATASEQIRARAAVRMGGRCSQPVTERVKTAARGRLEVRLAVLRDLRPVLAGVAQVALVELLRLGE